jgi:hypothetical protein
MPITPTFLADFYFSAMTTNPRMTNIRIIPASCIKTSTRLPLGQRDRDVILGAEGTAAGA